MNELYTPDLTKAELRALKNFLKDQKQKGKSRVSQKEIDDFMQEKHDSHGLFSNCMALVIKGDLIIKRPIGWKEN